MGCYNVKEHYYVSDKHKEEGKQKEEITKEVKKLEKKQSSKSLNQRGENEILGYGKSDS